MNRASDGKLCMKLAAFDKIYNFVVQSFFISRYLKAQIIDILSRSTWRVLFPTVVAHGWAQ
jgi:hypothetical protein